MNAVEQQQEDKRHDEKENSAAYRPRIVDRTVEEYLSSFGANLYHYRDYQGDEIDAIIELNNGKWCAIEIKLGANRIEEAAANLIRIKNKIVRDGGNPPSVLCVLVGVKNMANLRPDGVYVVPISALKN